MKNKKRREIAKKKQTNKQANHSKLNEINGLIKKFVQNVKSRSGEVNRNENIQIVLTQQTVINRKPQISICILQLNNVHVRFEEIQSQRHRDLVHGKRSP